MHNKSEFKFIRREDVILSDIQNQMYLIRYAMYISSVNLQLTIDTGSCLKIYNYTYDNTHEERSQVLKSCFYISIIVMFNFQLTLSLAMPNLLVRAVALLNRSHASLVLGGTARRADLLGQCRGGRVRGVRRGSRSRQERG